MLGFRVQGLAPCFGVMSSDLQHKEDCTDIVVTTAPAHGCFASFRAVGSRGVG